MSTKKNSSHSHSNLEQIWKQVPVDHYQLSMEKSILQRIWHLARLKYTLKFMDSLTKKRGLRILDIGCASGWFISEIQKKYPQYSYTGIDVYKDAIGYGKKRYKNVSFLVSDAHHLPFPAKSYDVVLCMNVLEHVVDPQQIVEEIKRVIKPTGIVIIGMDTENALFNIVWHIWCFIHKVWDDAHLHKFSPQQLIGLFEKKGFTVEKMKIFNVSMAVVFLLKPA